MSTQTELQSILDRAGQKGILVDQQLFESELQTLRKTRLELDTKALTMVGHPIRLASRKEVAAYLFDEQHLPETRNRSVSQEALLHHTHPFLPIYFAYSTVARTVSLMEKMPTFTVGGRVQTEWHGDNDTSGRIYCCDFNVQQLPVPGRRALVADPGYSIVMFDYQQFELRCLAALAQSPELIEMFKSGVDIHTATAARMLHLNPADVTTEQRGRGKAFNFGLLFGMNARGLSMRLDCSEQSAQEMIDAYFEEIPSVSAFISRTQAQVRSTGTIVNPFGHIRVVDEPDLNKADRIAVNTLVQGTAASLLKERLVEICSIPGVEFLATVHDSGIVQVPTDKLDVVVPALLAVVQREWGGVPFPVEYAVAHSWGQAQENLRSDYEGPI